MSIEKINITEDSFTLNRSFKKAFEYARNYRIKEDEFADLYGKENVEKDKRYVEEKIGEFSRKDKEDWEKENDQYADILEVIISDQVEKNEWFGSNNMSQLTSRYDDIRNGIDAVITIQEDNNSYSYTGLAADVSYSSDISKKVERIKREIDKGSLGSVKYFYSEESNIKGQLLQVPKVIVGCDKNTLKEIMPVWNNSENKKLCEHPIQHQLLSEVVEQLEVFKDYAEKRGNKKIASIYEKNLELFKKIQQERKEKCGENTDNRDSFYEELISEIRNKFKES